MCRSVDLVGTGQEFLHERTTSIRRDRQDLTAASKLVGFPVDASERCDVEAGAGEAVLANHLRAQLSAASHPACGRLPNFCSISRRILTTGSEASIATSSQVNRRPQRGRARGSGQQFSYI